MALRQVKFNLGEGGLARELGNEDHISCLLYDFQRPTSWSVTGLPVRLFRNLNQVEDSGIIEPSALFSEVWYQAKEFWRMHPDGMLYLAFEANTLTPAQIISATEGKVRQFAKSMLFSLASCNTTQDFLNELKALNAPAVMVVGLDLSSSSVLTPAEYPRNQNNSGLLPLIAGDGNAGGKALADALGVPCIISTGAVLGSLSKAQVHISPAWVGQFNFARTELELPILFDGSPIMDYNPAILDNLDDWGFVFFRKFVGLAGTYLTSSNAATSLNSDYAYIENSRTIHKAIRGVNAAVLPQLSSPLYVQPNGTLRPDTVGFFSSLITRPLVAMENAGELSGFSVEIDPNQNVLATSILNVVIKLLPVGVAREIIVQLGFTSSII